MITNNQIKYIRGLYLKKNRVVEKCFVVEGEKSINELLSSSFKIIHLFATRDWLSKNNYEGANEVSVSDLSRISNLKSPNNVLAVVEKKEQIEKIGSGFTLVIDNIKDPGNMGTIIRICDWFDIRKIVCSENTVDIYNPKVVQASMGSLFRVNILYANLSKYLQTVTKPIYGAYMQGKDIKKMNFHQDAYLVIGNESNGISSNLSKFIDHKVTIKKNGEKTESLNVAVATSILLYELSNSF